MLALMSWAAMAKNYIAARVGAVADEAGQDFIEYALIIGVISLVIVFLFMTTGLTTAVTTLVTQIQNCIDGATSTACNFGSN